MRNHLNLTWTVGVLATMLLGGGCSSSPKEATENVITVHTVTISGTSFSSPYHYVGTLEEETGASISFKVQGNVQRIYVNEGQKVAKGALLAQVDTETLQQSYNAAKASYEQAEDAIRRMKLLYDNQSLSEVKYVEAQTNVEQSKSMYEIAKQNLKDARLVAPVAGVIGRKSIEVGENVMPGQTAFSLLDIRSVKVKIAVPEREMAHLPVHAEAQIEIPALSDARYSGKIIEKGVVADGATHTYEVKIRLDNKGGELMPGMVCNVSINSGSDTDKRFILPNSAVQVTEKDEHFVWGVNNGTVTKIKVKVGALTGMGVVIENGLNEGVEVITEGMQKVSEGMKVNVL